MKYDIDPLLLEYIRSLEQKLAEKENELGNYLRRYVFGTL